MKGLEQIRADERALCKHSRQLRVWTASGYFTSYGERTVEKLVCAECHEQFPLGPASVDSDAVQLEIRAAEIVANNHATWPEAIAIDMYTHDCLVEPSGSREHSLVWHAGWLAAAIISHDLPAHLGGEVKP